MVISSHASYNDNCFNPFSEKEMKMYKDLITKQFVFVQHGIIMNDIHEFVNRCKITADLYITSTYKEYEYLRTPKFMYNKEMIVKTGLPRFDKLKNNNKKIILISPTWRQNLSLKKYNNDKKEDFFKSEYYKKYNSILNNKKLQELLKNSGYIIKFLLHPVFSENNDIYFNSDNEYIKIYKTKDIQYSELFNECSIFITDYSSIHFDVAILKKPIIYYQFDKKDFFSKHYKHGYFNYDTDGFGDVIEKEEKLIEKIEEYIKNNCKIEDKYLQKIENTFIYIDNNNSKRVYEEILKLDSKNEFNYRFNNVF